MMPVVSDIAKGPNGPALAAISLSAAGPLLSMGFGPSAAAEMRTGARACLQGQQAPDQYFETLENFPAQDGSIDAGYFVDTVVLPEMATSGQIWVAYFWGACRSKHHGEVEAIYEAQLEEPLSKVLAAWATPEWAKEVGSAIAEGEQIEPDEFDRTLLLDILPANPTVDRCYPVAQAHVELAKMRHVRALLDRLDATGRQRIEAILWDVGQKARGTDQ